nr:uncharacterized protein LOC106616968 [Bactrocera oleae]
MNSTKSLIFIIALLFVVALARGVPVVSSPYNSQTNSDLCTERKTKGFFADPSDTDCTRYINCYNLNGKWQTKLLKCPEGQFFDASLSICSSLYNCPL